ncbi:MAG: hypothetical protein M3040_04075 [Bacteroidota bacterium]|nr:hypothetical protein [Bacteroidota bacterium]
MIKTKYRDAQIALSSSPMMSGASRDLLQNCLITIKARIDGLHPFDKSVALFFLNRCSLMVAQVIQVLKTTPYLLINLFRFSKSCFEREKM